MTLKTQNPYPDHAISKCARDRGMVLRRICMGEPWLYKTEYLQIQYTTIITERKGRHTSPVRAENMPASREIDSISRSRQERTFRRRHFMKRAVALRCTLSLWLLLLFAPAF